MAGSLSKAATVSSRSRRSMVQGRGACRRLGVYHSRRTRRPDDFSHSPQALAWGFSVRDALENHLNGFHHSRALFPKLKLGENEIHSRAVFPQAEAWGER